MFRPESLLRLALRSAQRLRGVRGADHILEVVYVELWMLHALFASDPPKSSSFPCPSSLFAVVLTPPPPGHLDADLLRLGAHSQTFIQRERGIAATGLTRVLLVASGSRGSGCSSSAAGTLKGGAEVGDLGELGFLEGRLHCWVSGCPPSLCPPSSGGGGAVEEGWKSPGDAAREGRRPRAGDTLRVPSGSRPAEGSGLAPRSPRRPRAAAAGPGSQPLTPRNLAAPPGRPAGPAGPVPVPPGRGLHLP
ncbi:hypothetical protein CapIbe_012580 [Capra ibex]